jgi:hypothetical protein
MTGGLVATEPIAVNQVATSGHPNDMLADRFPVSRKHQLVYTAIGA